VRDQLLTSLKAAVATLATAVVSVGFVAFVGAAILWARFHVAQLPADQAVAVVPRSELVAVGASALVTFAALGLAAVLLVYLIDPQGRASKRMWAGLLALVVAELLVVIVLAGFTARHATLLVICFAGGAVLLGLAVHWLPSVVAGLTPDAAAAPPAADPPAPPPDPTDHVVRAVIVLAVLVVLFGVLWTTERWLAWVTLVVLVLAIADLAVAHASGEHFWPYAGAVFASVGLLGAVASLIEASDTPEVQAAAFLRSDATGGACALYVTETDQRLYLAPVDLLPGAADTRPRPGSGRLFSLPKDKLLAWSIGPLQSIGRAQAQAVALRDELIAQAPPAATATAVPEATPVSAASATPTPTATATPAGSTATATATAATATATAAPAAVPAGARVADLCSPRGVRAAERQSQDRTLARRFMPILSVANDDRFWPITVGTVFGLRGGRNDSVRTCLKAPGQSGCDRLGSAADVPWIGAANEWLEYPGDYTSATEQAAVLRKALGRNDPYATAREYFLAVPGTGTPALTSLQYWYFYGFNYQRIQHVPGVSAGYHEGDFESTGLLLSTHGRPVYLWTARHGTEGERFAIGEPSLQTTGDHVRVYAAVGSHATYATCGLQHRPHLNGAIDDRTPCAADNPLVFEPQSTPLSDLALAPWACFQGRFGHSVADQKLFTIAQGAIVADGPRTPLWQQQFGPVTAHPCEDTPEPPNRDAAGEETNDDVTGQRLRQISGSLAPLFSSCTFWQQRPTQGAYVSACDPAVLDRFFRSGLDVPGPEALRITPAKGRAAATIPAVLRSGDPSGLDGAVLSAAAPARPDVYVARYASPGSNQLYTAFFSAVAVAPGKSLRLQTSGTARWTLVDADHHEVASEVPALWRPSAPAGGAEDVAPGADTVGG
jgi:hypothetical protein